MKYDLILTAIDKRNEIERLFKSLISQKNFDVSKLRLIFVDQGCNKDLLHILENLIDVEYVSIDKSPLSVARNVGLKHIRGEVLGFPDDDCWYDINFFKKMEDLYISKPELDGLSFNVKDPDNGIIYGGRPISKENISIKNILRLPTSVGLFIRTENILKNNIKFDENLGAGKDWGSGEEMDFVHKLLEYDASILYVGDSYVFHPVVLKYDNFHIKKYLNYGKGFGALCSKLILKDEKEHLPYMHYLIRRGILGFLFSFITFNRINIKIYYFRTLGIILGFREGKKYYETNLR